MRKIALLLPLVAFAILLSACASRTPAPCLRLRSSAVRRSHESPVRFSLCHQPQWSPAFLDNEETVSFRRAEGDFISPNRARAVVRVITPGMVAEIQVISTAEGYWETNLLSGKWQALPPEMGFNPAVLFDPQIGFQPILETDLDNLKLLGSQELDRLPGKRLYHLSGDLDGKRLYELSYGMIGPESVSVQVWVTPESFEIERILIGEAPVEVEATLWQIDFSKFEQADRDHPPETKE